MGHAKNVCQELLKWRSMVFAMGMMVCTYDFFPYVFLGESYSDTFRVPVVLSQNFLQCIGVIDKCAQAIFL